MQGQATMVLSERFRTVTGVDPSKGMVATALSNSQDNSRVNFVQSSAEELSFLENESVDFVTAGSQQLFRSYHCQVNITLSTSRTLVQV